MWAKSCGPHSNIPLNEFLIGFLHDAFMFSTMPIKSQKYGIETLQGINEKYLHLYKEPIAERKKKDI